MHALLPSFSRSLCRSFAYMTCIIACYQIFIGARSAPVSVMVAVAAHHVRYMPYVCTVRIVAQLLTLEQALFPCLVIWLARDSKLSSLRPAPFHWPCAAVAAVAAMLLPRHAETEKGKKQD